MSTCTNTYYFKFLNISFQHLITNGYFLWIIYINKRQIFVRTKQSYKTGKTIRSTKKNKKDKKDKHVGRVELVKLPNNINRTWRWIVKKRADGRYIARAPKPNVLIRDLNKKRDNDFNAEHLLPKNFTF